MKILFLLVLFVSSLAFAEDIQDPYEFLKKRSAITKPQTTFNEYEDIISGGVAFVVGNLGYFTTTSSTLKIAYSGVQTVGVIGIGHGIYDYYYPHFESRLLGMLQKKQLTKKKLANDYVSLLGEMERAKRLSILWTSGLLTGQYALNAFVSKKVPQDLKDIYLFLGGVNAIVAIYSYFNVSEYEQYHLRDLEQKTHVGAIALPINGTFAPGLLITRTW